MSRTKTCEDCGTSRWESDPDYCETCLDAGTHVRCWRCEEPTHKDEISKGLCENCYDDVYVSWNSVIAKL